MTPTAATSLTRVTLRAPVKAGMAPAISSCSHEERLRLVFDTLTATWSDWRGIPWSAPYCSAAAAIPGLHSLRLSLLDQPAAVVLDSVGEAGRQGHLEALRSQFGPVLDLMFGDCDGYAGSGEAAAFATWAASAQWQEALAGTPALAELSYVRSVDGDAPAAQAASGTDAAFALHALADLHRLANLYLDDAGSNTLWRAARCLLPTLPAAEPAGNVTSDDALRAHVAESLAWHASPPPQTAPAPGAPIGSVGAVGAGVAAGMRNMHQVCGKKQVMEVLMDEPGNTSVRGYMERMSSSIGGIFLGLDKADPEYGRQSAAANKAIGAITEEEAFTRALEATREVMAPLNGAATWDMKDVSDQVLAKLCTLWFDVPDGSWVRAAGSLLPLPPPGCPGSFAPPSGYIFQPEPGLGVTLFGKIHGKMLHYAVGQMVSGLRRFGKSPAGVLSSAIFAAFPKSPDDDDLVARTLVGVMMGFLPTAQGNLVATMAQWKGATFAALRESLLAHPELDLYERADKVIRAPLMAAMQQSPMPPAVWRTALRDHDLGEVRVKAGDRLFVNIESATREDLGNKILDVYPVFGGNREQTPHPTHACPGFWMGMGVMLGIYSGLMEAEPTVSPATGSARSAAY